MTQLIKKANSGIKFDSSKRYVNKHNKQFGKGVWYRDSNNNGFYDKGEQFIKPGNRIRNNDFSYSQLNSDGTITKLSDNKGNVTKGLKNKLSDADKYAMKHKLVYGRIASYNDKTKKWERNNNNSVQWDIDTERNANDIDINNNQNMYISLPDGGFMRAIQQIKNGKYTEAAALLPNHNKIVDFGTTGNIPEKTYEFMQKIAYPINGNPVQQNSGLITQRTGDSPIGQYINPDTKQKTNYVRVNFGDTNGQNQYLKGNYWVYDDGNGNIQTIGFRHNGKDYAYVNFNGTSSFLNSNAKGTIIQSPSIASSKLTSYASGFTPGMSQWRGKAGWYINVGNKLPNNVAGAKNGYLYDKQGKMIGFNADGNYYILMTSVQPTHLGEAANVFVSGWKGLGKDLMNLFHRNITPTDMLGGLGDIGRGVQHLAQGTVGAATQALLPNEVTNTIGKYGQVLDPGKVISGIAHGKTPWDESNHGLVDFDPGNQSLQDINDVLNGATIIFGTKGAGTGLKGVGKTVINNSKTAAKIADATAATKAATKAGFAGVKDIYRNGARKQFINLPKPGTQLNTKAGIRPSNIVPMGEAFKKGFQNTYKLVYDQAQLNRIPKNWRFNIISSGPVITPKRPITSTVKNTQEIKLVNPELLPSVGSQNFTWIPSGDIISTSKPIITTPAIIPNTQNFIRVSSGPLELPHLQTRYYAAKPEPLALPHLQPRSISWNDAIKETKRSVNNSSKEVNNIQLPTIQQLIYSNPKINIKPKSQASKGLKQETPTITGNSQIEIPKTISWRDAKNVHRKSTQNLKRQQYNQSHNTKPSKTKLLKKRRYNN